MKRWCVLATALLAAAFVSGASLPKGGARTGEKKADQEKADEKKADEKAAKPPIMIGQKTAVFNMAAVMRDFNQAKYQVWLLNNKKNELSKNIVAWRNEYIKIQTELRQNPNHPTKDQMNLDLVKYARMIEDEDRKINKQLNDDASAIISDLYDKMKSVVDKIVKLNGIQIVLSYPDAVTAEELNSAYIKELKLKPPAAQPFYVDPSADITAAVVRALNAAYPPRDAAGKPVDVNKMEIPPPAPPEPLPTAPPLKIQLAPGTTIPDLGTGPMGGGARPRP